MSTSMTTPTARSRGTLTDRVFGGSRSRKLAYLLVGLVVLVSAVRVVSGEQALTSSSTFSAALLLAVPLVLVALGGLFSERAGVVNIGLEGMMVLGTWGAGYAGYQWGWGGALIGGAVFGAAGGLLHAMATVTFGVDHVVSGVAINILADGGQPRHADRPGVRRVPLAQTGLPAGRPGRAGLGRARHLR